MKNKFVITTALFIFFSAAPPLHALGRKDLGTTGASFLKLTISPRAAALAEAYGALGDDVASIYSNPAGLSALPKKQIQFSHAELVADIKLNSIFYAHPISKPYGTFALNYTLLDYGSMTRTILNSPGAGNPYTIAGNFSAYDHLLALAYSNEFLWGTHRFRWGMTAKFIQQTISDESATGLAYDLGLLYAPIGKTWRLGAAVQNLGFLSRFRYESDPLPVTLKLSVGNRFLRDRLRLGIDANLAIDNTPVISAGAEVLPIPALALRGGYRFDNNTSDYKGFTAGAGVTLAGVSLDYAYVPFERLGDNHRFSLSYAFGEARREPDYQTISNKPQESVPSSEISFPTPQKNQAASSHITVSVSVEEESSEYLEPIPPTPVAEKIMLGVRAMPFAYREGPEDYDWLGASTMEVLHKSWKKKGFYNSSGPFVVEGEYKVQNGKLTIIANLIINERVIGSFSESGAPDLPFEVWEKIIRAINGRLESIQRQ